MVISQRLCPDKGIVQRVKLKGDLMIRRPPPRKGPCPEPPEFPHSLKLEEDPFPLHLHLFSSYSCSSQISYHQAPTLTYPLRNYTRRPGRWHTKHPPFPGSSHNIHNELLRSALDSPTACPALSRGLLGACIHLQAFGFLFLFILPISRRLG